MDISIGTDEGGEVFHSCQVSEFDAASQFLAVEAKAGFLNRWFGNCLLIVAANNGQAT
jgi:hypothetical protein